jgi:hypothetical protein
MPIPDLLPECNLRRELLAILAQADQLSTLPVDMPPTSSQERLNPASCRFRTNSGMSMVNVPHFTPFLGLVTLSHWYLEGRELKT